MKKHIRYDVIFVLNGLQNGEEGCYAHDLMGKQLADGWYYLTDIDDDVVNSKRLQSLDAAKRSAEAYIAEVIRGNCNLIFLSEANGISIKAIGHLASVSKTELRHVD
jgi:hypothetical protein